VNTVVDFSSFWRVAAAAAAAAAVVVENDIKEDSRLDN
jgi:anti-sigma-K factor RskA